jgi:hypothetical protein
VSFRNSAFGIYQAIEKVLKASKKPLTCVDLFEYEEIKKHAEDINKVSDYLGHMWRRSNSLSSKKQFVGREAAHGAGSARWAYYWKNHEIGTPIPVQRKAQPRLQVVNLREREQAIKETSAVLADTTSVKVLKTERGEIVIETLHHTIIIAPK